MPSRSKTKIKYNPTDLSRIYVFDETINKFIEVEALNQEYTIGLTLWQHQVVKNLACQEAEKVDIVALALAKEKIQAIVAQEWQKTKKGKTRQSMARWLEIGTDELSFSDDSDSNKMEKSEIVGEIEPTFDRESRELNGISNLDNALENCETETINQPIVVNNKSAQRSSKQEKINKNNSRNSTKKKNSKNSHSKSVEKVEPKKSVLSSDSTVTEVKETSKKSQFQPDLTNWDVTNGLPK